MHIEGFDFPPFYVVILFAHVDVVMDAMAAHILDHLRTKVDSHDPAAVVFDVIVPVLIVAVVVTMKDEDHSLLYTSIWT